MTAIAITVALGIVGFALWRILFGPIKPPPGWDVPPADWVEEMQRREREFNAKDQGG